MSDHIRGQANMSKLVNSNGIKKDLAEGLQHLSDTIIGSAGISPHGILRRSNREF